jgi:protein O-GlcNAc transferase
MTPGRNDPCLCGSGRKYKKCCGASTPRANSGQPLAALNALTHLAPSAAEIQAAVSMFTNGRHWETELLVRDLIKRYPKSADGWKILGHSLRAQGKPALEAFRTAAMLAPNDPDSYINLGVAAALVGDSDDAMSNYRRALTIDPTLAIAHLAICSLYIWMGDFERARTQAELLEQYHPVSAESFLAWGRLGNAIGHDDDAIDYFKRAVVVSPGCQSGITIAELEERTHDTRTLKEKLFYAGLIQAAEVEARRDFAEAATVENHNFLLMCLHANPERSSQDYYAEARRWAELHGNEDLLPSPAAYPNERSPKRRLRVGILGDYFTNYICITTLVPFFDRYDRNELEIYCYNYGDSAEELFGKVDRWKEIHKFSPDEFYDLVVRDKIDIMLDINGRLRNPQFFPAMLRQPAPIQVNWYNLTATVGHKAYNYLITDDYSVRGGEEGCYVENIFRMPTGTISSFDMGEPPPKPIPPPCDSNDFVTFGSFGDFFKVNETVLRTWGMLLSQVPNSRLYLKGRYLQMAECRKRITNYFENMQISADRLLLEGMSEYRLMKIRYSKVDIALDTFPYSGGSTTINALWQGVPVIAISGPSWRERNAASILAGAGLHELIATDVDDYLDKAINLANDRVRLQRYRSTISETMSASPQWQTERFARNFEHTLRSMWIDWLETSTTTAN